MKNARKPSAMPAQPIALRGLMPPPPLCGGAASRIRYTTSTSVETNSTTKPWIIHVRLDASAGSKIDGSRERVDVPVVSAPNSRAENSVPIAVLRPSSATAIPEKPSVESWMSLVAIRNCQPSTSSVPASPANAPQTAITRM